MTGSFMDPSVEEVLRMELSALRGLKWHQFGRDITDEEVTHVLKTCDGLWLHSGDPKTPHAELTSGMCSDGFANTLAMLRYTNLCEIMAQHVIRRFNKAYKGPVGWVIGSDHAGAVFSYEVARQLSAQHDFTEKGPDDTQLWKRFNIGPEEPVLQAEELITTTKTLRAVREGIRLGNRGPVKFAPVILALVHRSGVYEFEGVPIVYLVHYDIKVWEPKSCPLCAQGSKRFRPKQH